MKKLLKKIWKSIASVFNKIEAKTKQYVPVAIKVVEALKKVMDSPVDDVIFTIIKNSIPGNADDILADKISATLQEWLPKILLDLKLINSIANEEDQNAQLNAILAQLKLSSNETQNIFYHGLCSLIIEKLSDGELSWSDSVAISEYYYKNVMKNEKNPAV